jgi:type I restriction enzyme R subunit
VQTTNFGFLSVHDAKLVQLGTLAKRYFHHDPGTAIFKLRQLAELLSKTIAAGHAPYLGERETFEETLRGLSYKRAAPREVTDVFHALRKAGNKTAHETRGSHSTVLARPHKQAPARYGRARRNRRAVLRLTTAAGSGGLFDHVVSAHKY